MEDAKQATTTIQCEWTDHARAAGLAEIDGWGDRSLMGGTRAQWAIFVRSLEKMDRAGWSRGEKVSHTAVLNRARQCTTEAEWDEDRGERGEWVTYEIVYEGPRNGFAVRRGDGSLVTEFLHAEAAELALTAAVRCNH